MEDQINELRKRIQGHMDGGMFRKTDQRLLKDIVRACASSELRHEDFGKCVGLSASQIKNTMYRGRHLIKKEAGKSTDVCFYLSINGAALARRCTGMKKGKKRYPFTF